MVRAGGGEDIKIRQKHNYKVTVVSVIKQAASRGGKNGNCP